MENGTVMPDGESAKQRNGDKIKLPTIEPELIGENRLLRETSKQLRSDLRTVIAENRLLRQKIRGFFGIQIRTLPNSPIP
jgi:hypothetical protein